MSTVRMVRCDGCSTTVGEDARQNWVRIEGSGYIGHRYALDPGTHDFCSPWCLYQKLEREQKQQAAAETPKEQEPVVVEAPPFEKHTGCFGGGR